MARQDNINGLSPPQNERRLLETETTLGLDIKADDGAADERRFEMTTLLLEYML